MWRWTVAAAVASAWRVWAPEAPNEIAASLPVGAPADSDLPPIVTVFGAVLGQESAARAALHEFVADVGAAPTEANYVSGPYRDIKRYLAEYDICSGERRPVERDDGHSYSKSKFFRREFPADVIAELLSRLADGRRQREARVLDFTPWGGAYNRVPADATSFAHRAERFLLKQEVVVDASGGRAASRTWLALALLGARPRMGLGWRVPELPRPRAGGLGACVPRGEPGPAQAGESDVRRRERLPIRSVGPAHSASSIRSGFNHDSDAASL